MKLFKIRCSEIYKIMGRIGLTDKQEQKLKELYSKPKLTAKQEETYYDLLSKKVNPSLPQTCITHLKEWYAYNQYHDKSDFHTKETDKGNLMENEAINLIEYMEGEDFLIKNEKLFEDEYMIGTPDVISKIGYDAKCSWSSKTFLESISDELEPMYEWQMRGYIRLTNLDEFKVCYCLLNTPSEVNYGNEIKYDDIPEYERYKSFSVFRDLEIENEIITRVLLCREWLDDYHIKIQNLLKSR